MQAIGRSFRNLWVIFSHEFKLFFVSPIVYIIACAWIALATTSLPVPVSPKINTELIVAAMVSTQMRASSSAAPPSKPAISPGREPK